MKIKKKWIVGIPLIIAIVLLIGLYYIMDNNKENTFSASEKKWIEDHISTIIDFDILYDYPVFGESGVFKSFINDFGEETGFEFNIIPYYRKDELKSTGYRFRALNNQDVMTDKDLLLHEDVYAIYGKNEGRINSINELGEKTIGVLNNDSDEVFYYLKSYTSLKYKTYDSADVMFSDYESKKIDLIIMPNLMYLDKTLNNKQYNIKYIITELNKRIVLTLVDDEKSETMNNILKKYFNNWTETKYINEYNKTLLDYYVSKTNINDKEKTEFLTKSYKYGFVENMPYESLD